MSPSPADEITEMFDATSLLDEPELLRSRFHEDSYVLLRDVLNRASVGRARQQILGLLHETRATSIPTMVAEIHAPCIRLLAARRAKAFQKINMDLMTKEPACKGPRDLDIDAHLLLGSLLKCPFESALSSEERNMAETRGARDPEVQELLDKNAIREALMRYCRGVDRLDIPLINSTFHPDAINEHWMTGPPLIGEEIGQSIVDFEGKMKKTMHNITNQVISLHGDSAGSETYWVVWQIRIDGDDEVRFHNVGRYIDRFERRNGEWKIAHRLVVREFSTQDPVVRVRSGSAQRDLTDPSYAVLGN
jgi:hypothetical protein